MSIKEKNQYDTFLEMYEDKTKGKIEWEIRNILQSNPLLKEICSIPSSNFKLAKELQLAIYQIFNLGLEIAAENGQATYDYLGNERDLDFYYENIITKIVKESILKYKL